MVSEDKLSIFTGNANRELANNICKYLNLKLGDASVGRFSEGEISIKSQISDALKIIEFIRIIAKEKIFDKDNINILSYDFGAYIALILCSKIKEINRLLSNRF